jgi:hypothetical protein
MAARFICHHCEGDLGPDQVYVEWSTEAPVADADDAREMAREGCVAEQFCSWICAGRWFCDRAGREAPAIQEKRS